MLTLRLDRFASPVGTLLLLTEGPALRVLDFEGCTPRMERLLRAHYGEVAVEPGAAPSALRGALEAYFAGELTAVDAVEVRTAGTPFQREVWAALRTIPAGGTLSYGALAARIGRPGASRAVGLANGANPVGLVIPCHRVIGAKGALTGYGGGLDRKRALLEHEARHRRAPSARAPAPVTADLFAAG